MNNELIELLARPTADVPDVGRICFGLSKNASYEAARRGDIKTVRMGRLLKVPTSWVRQVIGIETPAAG